MRTEHKLDGITWIHLENPSRAETRAIIDEFEVTPIAADELLSPTVRSKVDVYDDFLYLILHFPVTVSPHLNDLNTKQVQEIDFIVSKKFIITTSYAPINEISEFQKIFEMNAALNKHHKGNHAGHALHHLIHLLYKQMMNRVETVRDFMQETEQNIFKGEERQMVEELSRINRILLTFKEELGSHGVALQSFEVAAKKFYGDDFAYYARNMLSEYQRVLQAVKNAKEYVTDLRETNDSLLSTKQNEVMKTLTVMAFVILPLSLIASIFGMNARFMPFIGQPHDFLIILFLMFTLTVIMFAYFKVKKWL